MNVRHLALAAIAVLAVAGTASAQQGSPSSQLAQASPTPAASSSPAPRGRRRGRAPSPEPSASETPEPPQFSTMDGVWEVQLQPLRSSKTIYSHLFVKQSGEALTGTWVRNDKDKVAFTGTFDGRLFKITASGAKGTWTLAGYAENFSDMVGMLTTADPKDQGTPFTASHRKKEKISIGGA